MAIGKTAGLIKDGLRAHENMEAYRIVKLMDANTAQYADAATDILEGTTLRKVDQGEPVGIDLNGVQLVECGGAVTLGAWLTTNGDAKAIATTTAGNYVIGRAMAAGVSGDVIPYRAGLNGVL